LNNFKDNSFVAGKVVGVHGVRGLIKVKLFVDYTLFKPGNHIFLITDQGEVKQYNLISIKPHKKAFLLTIEDIDNRSDAQTLIGLNIIFDHTKLPPLEEDTYYWRDIIGLKVYEVTSYNYLGYVKSIIETGSNDVYVVENEKNGIEILIPAIDSIIKKIDIKNKKMIALSPE